MSAVDYERVLLGLKAHVASKRSHGRPELLEVIAGLEVRYQVPEGMEGFSDLPARRPANGKSNKPAVARPA